LGLHPLLPEQNEINNKKKMLNWPIKIERNIKFWDRKKYLATFTWQIKIRTNSCVTVVHYTSPKNMNSLPVLNAPEFTAEKAVRGKLCS
jgi:hypothetical protein